MSEPVILYDIPSQEPCRSWSGNVWKTRYALNYKGIPYKTEWTPYTVLQDKIKSLGVPPNPPGSWSTYSVPTLHFPDGTSTMDSAAIATALESRYPSTPSLHLNPDLEKEAGEAMFAVFMSLTPLLLPLSKNLVADVDMAWFQEDRAQRFEQLGLGMSMEEAFAEKDPAPFYAAAGPGFERVVGVLTRYKVDEGPFVLGSQVCYADFVMAATLRMFSRGGGEFWTEFWRRAPVEVRALHEGCERWAGKQD